MSKALDRAFNKVIAGHRLAEEAVQAQLPLSQQELEAREVERLRTTAAPMVVSDAIKRMLLAEEDKDYFRLLELPPPNIDALGRPTWISTAADVSKAYRKLSALVHPDKNPSSDARQAFEALNKAHRLLRDPGELEKALNSHIEIAKRRRETAEAAATADERAILYAVKRTEAQQLRKSEAEKFQAELLQQRQRLQERARRKQELQEKSRKRELEHECSDDDAVDLREQQRHPGQVKRRSKPKLIF